MQDPRTQRVLELAVTLLSSGNPNYQNRTVAEVTAELLGSVDGIDHTFGICTCDGESEH